MALLVSRAMTVPLWLVAVALVVFSRSSDKDEGLALLFAVGLLLSVTAVVLSKYFNRTPSPSPAAAPASSRARAMAASDARDLARMDSDLG